MTSALGRMPDHYEVSQAKRKIRMLNKKRQRISFFCSVLSVTVTAGSKTWYHMMNLIGLWSTDALDIYIQHIILVYLLPYSVKAQLIPFDLKLHLMITSYFRYSGLTFSESTAA